MRSRRCRRSTLRWVRRKKVDSPSTFTSSRCNRRQIFSALAGSEGRLEDFVVDRQKAAVGAGVTLTATAAGQLPVDARRVMDLGHDHVQSAQLPRHRRPV